MLESLCEFFVVLGKVIYAWLEAVFLFFVPTSFIAKDISGQTVLVTGAGSGIGRLLALEFASHSCRLALWDVNSSGNEETAAMVKKLGTVARTYTVDVSDKDNVYAAAKKVMSDLGSVDILVNNAGIVTGRKFLDCPDSMVLKTMQVNSMAHFWTVKAFLPSMMIRNHGHIVTIASSAGLLGVTGLSDYCASKFAAVGFDESLRNELMAQNKEGIHTTVVCPYLISTGMFDGCSVRFPWLMNALEPEYVAHQIMKAILRNQEFIILPHVLYCFYALKGILPVKCAWLLQDYLGASAMMDTFKGRVAN
ncbi:epidermal retinol dehydrogenase 2-like [Pomacea canaliculata]|uniref:epidermal retinol dehydrogenase 2-like n=1 Tax=Pomacea canaliculata TaxID=400727 RepID=UPI000D7288BB|nr:epidermal retinol dehydrogenase 2-like [Pomacea canaliculata]XP_025091030.1 epidermal retinol dehydrogenase 2-like [Pomacea canaliculata]XP_025091031.1 epidermal retinol dehydrogenase 2-like [Pomacea canaliculata]XP_025091032.1 epidermal retinol dehydrogenase 2-like [Pomacea canaliculata]XP_025091033.1 epidermal retinol dehydrogenase 2-like [Pomacea canaliculata]XP_025091034.1 epidermal retinol dehydrogenase 2-like [Pomacea canaliculata]XP_025091035.1 epidermal retinol dehydrogenase 2-like